ncbi:MAG: septum formation protein Maf, partial [Gammaproteobacteria bacterium]|nr:septum formation protein Maf [Gammaproteobacteria bacterium]
ETPIEGESIENMVMRLSELKAEAIAEQIKGQDALIIGSDQSAVLNGEPLTKPGNFENAVKQLTAASGQRIIFQTGLCLLNSKTGKKQTLCEAYTVVFKELSPEVIEHYLKIEEPYNCAGSFKSEGLGIALFEKFEGEDPNSLIGLPLIKLIDMLENEGLNVLG